MSSTVQNDTSIKFVSDSSGKKDGFKMCFTEFIPSFQPTVNSTTAITPQPIVESTGAPIKSPTKHPTKLPTPRASDINKVRSPTRKPTFQASDGSHNKLNNQEIGGIVGGIAGGLVLIGAISYYRMRKNNYETIDLNVENTGKRIGSLSF